jgi:hypothetical protein
MPAAAPNIGRCIRELIRGNVETTLYLLIMVGAFCTTDGDEQCLVHFDAFAAGAVGGVLRHPGHAVAVASQPGRAAPWTGS